MDIGSLIIMLVLGAVAGWLASILMGSGGGLIRNIIMGIAGSFVGNYLLSLFKITLPISGILGTIIVSAIGACVVIAIGKLLFK